MAAEQLYASFLLDEKQGLEIALRAESVSEATPIYGRIQPLPASVDFVEGIMHLRENVIPIINLKSRLGLSEKGYADTAKVAVVKLFHRQYGLLFDDIKEVFAAGEGEVQKLDGALQTEDRIISALIQRTKGSRTVELLDLNNLFPGSKLELEKVGESLQGEKIQKKETQYLRYVVFNFAEQSFGIPVDCVQEITFFDPQQNTYSNEDTEKKSTKSQSLKDLFKHADIDGTLTLRGRTIPVLGASRILKGIGLSDFECLGENSRIMVLAKDGCRVGLIVEEVTTIETIPEDEILSMGSSDNLSVSGIYQKTEDHNIMLLNIEYLVCDRMDELKAMGRLSCDMETPEVEDRTLSAGSSHILTENCYLVFGVGQHLAVQLKDVQEILEEQVILGIPGGGGFSRGVINLRGQVVPVLSLREFYGFRNGDPVDQDKKLIICRAESRTIALEVDNIVTIFKQEKYQKTTSLKADLEKKEDTLDRLIVFDGGDSRKEHVLVINIHNLIRNHLDITTV